MGYLGGRWTNGVFAYNRTVNNFGTVRVTNVYEEKITINNATRVSFNGGPSGIAVRPTPEEEAVAREQHVAAIPHKFSTSGQPAPTKSCSRLKTTAAPRSPPRPNPGSSLAKA